MTEPRLTRLVIDFGPEVEIGECIDEIYSTQPDELWWNKVQDGPMRGDTAFCSLGQCRAEVQVGERVSDGLSPDRVCCCCGDAQAREGGRVGGIPKFKMCGGCRAIHYCSLACQHRHWVLHKTDCKKMHLSESLAKLLEERLDKGLLGSGW